MAKMQKAPRVVPPASFLENTYRLVDDSNTDNIVSWTDDGTRFTVKNTEEFTEVVLPRYFKHKKFRSFTRQLNTYGFKKVPGQSHEYEHENFKKDAYERLVQIERRIPIPKPASFSNTGEEQVISSNSQPGAIAVADVKMVQENKRLKKENAALKQELHRARSMVGHVAGDETVGSDVAVEASGTCAKGFRLFGVDMKESNA